MKIRTAVVEGSLVVNIIEFDEVVPESPIDGQIWIASEYAQIGDDYADGSFISHEKPVAPAPSVPQSVTMRQARLALLKAGKLDAVNTAIANMPGSEGEAARIEWEYAQEVRRDSPLAAGLSAALGLTDETLDNLYKVAAGL